MNLRILKKLSKRAAPYLPLLGDKREQFRSERWDSHPLPLIGDRKHWDRSWCREDYEPRNDWSTPRGKQIKFTTRKGRTMLMQPPHSPRKGTIMVGACWGGDEPEWEDETAWGALHTLVLHHFTPASAWAAFAQWDGEGEPPQWSLERPLNTPRQIFQAADDMLREQGGIQ